MGRKFVLRVYDLTFSRFVGYFAAAGVVIALILWSAFEIAISLSFSSSAITDLNLVLAKFWPASIGLMALGGEPWYSPLVLLLFAIYLSINALLYGVIGAFTCYGLHRRRWVLLLTIGVVGYGMYHLG